MSLPEPSGTEKRRLKRWYLVMYLRVYDRDTNELLGHIVDINKEGMRLVNDKPLPVNQIYRLRVDVPKEGAPRQRIHLEGETVWTGRDVNPDFYDTGFRMLNISTQALLQLQLLIEEFKF
ncbi:MAG TPA: PilZ domain-containing protein [Candidatus Competibacter sp.]|nr:PilZ domain-containing protein [Candidatus Competibacteraceae bacterium]HRC71090.1 PilZ domain-containing protein [Candidatus Competibacter sp.]